MTTKDNYYNWLCSLIDPRGYFRLLKQLDSTEFVYILPKDANRFEDGISLRYRFGDAIGLTQSEISSELDDHNCSIFEMMVALALRMEEEIMSDSTFGNRTSMWFWDMIRCLGLYDMSDTNYNANYVEERLLIFINRTYDYNGAGGLFYVERPRQDMRITDIWYQMQWYLTEKGD